MHEIAGSWGGSGRPRLHAIGKPSSTTTGLKLEDVS